LVQVVVEGDGEHPVACQRDDQGDDDDGDGTACGGLLESEVEEVM
jgi:hypothetical protein